MKLKITVHGVAYEVDVEVLDAADEMRQAAGPLPSVAPVAAPAPIAGPAPPPPGASAALPAPAPVGANCVASPIAGTVLQVKVKPGDRVTQGQALLVIEAMKMEPAIAAPTAGVVKSVDVAAGDTVRENQTLVEFES